MADYNKIITTVNSITPDYEFIPNLNNTIVIDTSENRIGINTITPDVSIHVSGGTIKSKDVIILNDLSVNNFSSNLIPRDDNSYNIGNIDYRFNDLFVGSNIYIDKTPILKMGDYTRGGLDASALIINNAGSYLDISDIIQVNITGDVSINKNLDITGNLRSLSDVSFSGSKFYIDNDTSFNNTVNISGLLTCLNDVSFLGKLLVTEDASFNSDVEISGNLFINHKFRDHHNDLSSTSTKIYTERVIIDGDYHTRLTIDPANYGERTTGSGYGHVVIDGNLFVKGNTTYISSTNVDISDNIIRMNANHFGHKSSDGMVKNGGIAVITNKVPVAGTHEVKHFTYYNDGMYTDFAAGDGNDFSGNFWDTDDTNLNLNTAGITASSFMYIGDIELRLNTINTTDGNLVIKASGEIDIESSTILSGDSTLTVTGATTLNSDFTVLGASNLASLTVTGATTSDTLTVAGETKSASLTVSGETKSASLDVSGATTSNTLTVAGETTSASLTVAGATTSNTLTVAGETKLGSLDVSGATTLYELTVPGSGWGGKIKFMDITGYTERTMIHHIPPVLDHHKLDFKVDNSRPLRLGRITLASKSYIEIEEYTSAAVGTGGRYQASDTPPTYINLGQKLYDLEKRIEVLEAQDVTALIQDVSDVVWDTSGVAALTTLVGNLETAWDGFADGSTGSTMRTVLDSKVHDGAKIALTPDGQNGCTGGKGCRSVTDFKQAGKDSDEIQSGWHKLDANFDHGYDGKIRIYMNRS